MVYSFDLFADFLALLISLLGIKVLLLSFTGLILPDFIQRKIVIGVTFNNLAASVIVNISFVSTSNFAMLVRYNNYSRLLNFVNRVIKSPAGEAGLLKKGTMKLEL